MRGRKRAMKRRERGMYRYVKGRGKDETKIKGTRMEGRGWERR